MWDMSRFIYTVVVGGLSIILAIIWIFPFSSSFINYPVDFLLSIMWFVAFGLLANWFGNGCGNIIVWNRFWFARGRTCSELKADIAFCFLSAILWLISAMVGVYWTHRQLPIAAGTNRRRKWYRTNV